MARNSFKVNRMKDKTARVYAHKTLSKAYCNAYIIPYLSCVSTNPHVLGDESANNVSTGRNIHPKAIDFSNDKGTRVSSSTVGLTNDRGFINYRQNIQYYSNTIERLEHELILKGGKYRLKELFLEILTNGQTLDEFVVRLEKQGIYNLHPKHLYDLGLIDVIRPVLYDGATYGKNDRSIYANLKENEFSNQYQFKKRDLARDASKGFLNNYQNTVPTINIGVIDGIVYTTTKSIQMSCIDAYQQNNTFELPCVDIIVKTVKDLLLADYKQDYIYYGNQPIRVNELAEPVGVNYGKFDIPFYSMRTLMGEETRVQHFPIGKYTITASQTYEIGGNYFPFYSIQRGSSYNSGFRINISSLLRADEELKIEGKLGIKSKINALPPMGDIIPIMKLFNYNNTVVALPLTLDCNTIYTIADIGTVLGRCINNYKGIVNSYKKYSSSYNDSSEIDINYVNMNLAQLTDDMLASLDKTELYQNSINIVYNRLSKVVNSLGDVFMKDKQITEEVKKTNIYVKSSVDDFSYLNKETSISVSSESTNEKPLEVTEIVEEKIKVEKPVEKHVTTQPTEQAIQQPQPIQPVTNYDYKCKTRLSTTKKFIL